MKLFKSARLKLTFWYTLIVFIILLFYSVVSYNALVDSAEHALMKQQRRLMRVGFMYDQNGNWYLRNYLDRDLDDISNQRIVDIRTLEDIKSEVAIKIIIIDVSILTLSAILSYFLAGITLKPIKVMVDDQKRFFSDAAHELRTPLTVMKSDIDVALMNPKLKKTDIISTLKNNLIEIENMKKLTDELLRERESLSTTNTLNKEDFDIYDLINDVVNKFESRAKQSKIKLKLSGTHIMISADKRKIQELITILIDNSIKYSQPDGGTVDVEIYQRNKKVFIKVTDDGIGISKNDIKKVFNRFYRVDTSRSRAIGGYGLGLSIARSIVESHKGKIDIKSEKDKGTTVIVSLPLK